MKNNSQHKFLGIDPPYSEYKNSRFVIIPVPFEATTTYGKGTKKGPLAIINASKNIELYDHELDKEPFKAGIFTQKQVKANPRNFKKTISKAVKKILGDNKIPVMMGGEHSISFPAISTCSEKYEKLSVLQIDAHADLRDEYNGSKFNHGCVMRRTLEVCPVVQVGVRSMDIGEKEFAQKTGQWSRIHFAEKRDIVDEVLSQLSDEVYITFDVDALDPSIMASTGTPEPGGLGYYEVLNIVKKVAEKKKVVGFDIVELSPIKGLVYPDFVAAKLIYKFIGYMSNK